MPENELFDEWPERYERWFATPIGKLVAEVEGELISSLLAPGPGERVIDAGCGTGVFTDAFLAAGAEVTGIDISRPMLSFARDKMAGYRFSPVQADIRRLPFADNSFDKAVSITALEFIEDARGAVDELFRVTRPGGRVVVATLNSLSPWATRRKAKTLKGQGHILEGAFFRSPQELLACSPFTGITRTAVHFQNDDNPEEAVAAEHLGRSLGLDTGAFLAACWVKPGPRL